MKRNDHFETFIALIKIIGKTGWYIDFSVYFFIFGLINRNFFLKFFIRIQAVFKVEKI